MTKEQKMRVWEAAGWRCEKPYCGRTLLHPHHIIYRAHKEAWMDEWFDEPENVMALCLRCHDWVHKSRKNMMKIFDAIKDLPTFRHHKPLEIMERKYGQQDEVQRVVED